VLHRLGFLVFAIALAGCGGGHKSAHNPRLRAVAASHAPQLVSMRRINGATWQTVVIRTDGTGDVGIFIGEWTGTHHRQFRLGGRELGQLRHLVAIAGHTGQTPAFGSATPSVEYIIFEQRRVFETATGHIPRQLAGLTAT
jgi:hypothetical protein